MVMPAMAPEIQLDQPANPINSGPPEGWELSLLHSDIEIKPQGIAAVTDMEADASFLSEACPNYAPAEKVRLKFTRPEDNFDLFVDGVVKGVYLNETIRRFTIRFEDPIDFETEAAQAPENQANRRQAVRAAAPAGKQPIEVDLHWEDGSTRGQLLDISTTGLGLRIATGVAEALDLPNSLRVLMDLPGIEMRFDIVGSIPYRRAVDGYYHYGIKFDWGRTHFFYRQESAISTFIISRQQEIIRGETSQYIAIDKSQLRFYRKTPLYFKSVDDRFRQFKPSGITVGKMRQTRTPLPQLYIRHKDRPDAVTEIQKGLNDRLQEDITFGSLPGIKQTLVEIFEVAVSDPGTGTLNILSETVAIVIEAFNRKPKLRKSLVSAPYRTYTPHVHSINLSILALNYGFYCKLPASDLLQLGLSGLLHDVGKIQLPDAILYPERRLTDEQFEMLKSHPFRSYSIIQTESDLDALVALGALEHHEKLDGSGYPEGKSLISYPGQILAVLDAYEHLTNFHRPYRWRKTPIDTLQLLKSEVEAGQYNEAIFKQFCYSLT